MKEMKYVEILMNPGSVSLTEIPVLEYTVFREQTINLLKKDSCHCLNYFTHITKGILNFYMMIGNDDSHRIYIFSHQQSSDIKLLKSISEECFEIHVFERVISENTGIFFEGHPWQKPVRYPHNRSGKCLEISKYPFYKIDSEEIHEVGVGPVHAGIIEPGHFRFLCYGERVLHLEIQLGYQHRGIEDLFITKNRQLQRSVLSESIAGDTAVGHGLAYAQLAECLAVISTGEAIEIERIIALELERMAIHIGDTAALCGDVAYQPGQSACEALRTMIINTMQDWCGNRFGKGLIRAGGSNYPLNEEIISVVQKRLKEVYKRFTGIADMIFNNSGILARFENTGALSTRQAYLAGVVGMAARTSGVHRDIRRSHPFQEYSRYDYKPAFLEKGDVLARAMIRKSEFDLSYSVIIDLLHKIKTLKNQILTRPNYHLKFKPGKLGVSLVEGWRGEICHTALTDDNGNIETYRIKDPSVHNWLVLAIAVRDQEISDFPICNKSFNLSYCGHDL
jgi:Ni,Fe-hydrogenase III large subunit